MFTGIIREIGSVLRVGRGTDGLHLWVQGPQTLQGAHLGDSIAVSGVCLTVEDLAGSSFRASLMAQTARVSTLGQARAGQRVNLEASLRPTDRLGGHLVFGHVDAAVPVLEGRQEGECRLLEVGLPPELARYLAPRGSVALDGVSLTVTAVEEDRFTVSLVRATLEATTLGQARVGDRLNLEVDMLARYLDRLLRAGVAAGAPALPLALSLERLAELGYG